MHVKLAFLAVFTSSARRFHDRLHGSAAHSSTTEIARRSSVSRAAPWRRIMTPLATLPALSASALCLALVIATAGSLRAQEHTTLNSGGSKTCLPMYQEATDLVSVGVDVAGRRQSMEPTAAAAWRAMQRAATSDGVMLLLVSAFRSIEQQQRIFERKLCAGQMLEDILAVNVPPGFSQHHTGLAVDVGTPGSTALLEDFEKTAAFRWLGAHARDYGFSLTYPRGNDFGLSYEPWHWAFGENKAPRFSR